MEFATRNRSARLEFSIQVLSIIDVSDKISLTGAIKHGIVKVWLQKIMIFAKIAGNSRFSSFLRVFHILTVLVEYSELHENAELNRFWNLT